MLLITYVAPAMINSVVLDFVNQERIRRYETVDNMTMTIRIAKVLIRLHTTTGIIKRSVTKENNSALAVRRINWPRYMYTSGLMERS